MNHSISCQPASLFEVKCPILLTVNFSRFLNNFITVNLLRPRRKTLAYSYRKQAVGQACSSSAELWAPFRYENVQGGVGGGGRREQCRVL